MLCLKRKKGQAVLVDGRLKIFVHDLSGRCATLGFDGPLDVRRIAGDASAVDPEPPKPLAIAAQLEDRLVFTVRADRRHAFVRARNPIDGTSTVVALNAEHCRDVARWFSRAAAAIEAARQTAPVERTA